MEASASTSQHAFSHRSQGVNMSFDGAQGPHQALYGSPGPSEQPKPPPQHQKPFFYVQPSQPYVPMQNMQWHVPVSYNPYYGYPGLGYGMPAMNTYPMNAYMEPPEYVMPQTHLHLMDYRRVLNPHYYQTLAYHSRRLHYQQNSPGRDMISSEVQTEPLLWSQKSGQSAAAAACGGGRAEAHNGLPDGRHNYPEKNYMGPASPLPQALSVKSGDGLADLKKTSPSHIENAPQTGGFLIQTEEVRIECCGTAVGLEVLRSRETQELALAHCYAAQDLGSVITQSPVLQEVAMTAPKEQSDNGHQACPDVLSVGTASCSSTDGVPSLTETKAPVKLDDVSPESGSRVEVCGGVAQKTTVQGQKRSNDGHFKVLHMPFDLDELQNVDTTVWSLEEMCVSSDWMTQNTLVDSHMETVVTEVKAPCEDLIDVFSEEVPIEQVVPMIELPDSEEELLIELGSTRDVHVVTLSSPSDGLASADVCVTEVASLAHFVQATGVSHSHSSELVVSVPSIADAIRQELELNDQSHQETSFESLPAYLPSTAWPNDCTNELRCREVPQNPKKPSKPQSARVSEAPIRRRKLDLESKELHAVPSPAVENLYKNKRNVDRRSVSDHECCLRRNLDENAFPARRRGAERLCTRCLANRGGRWSVGPEPSRVFKRKWANPLQPWLRDCDLPTCGACEARAKKRLTHCAAATDVVGGETSENSGSCRPAPARSPVALCPTLREKNCACDERRVPGWEGLRRRPRGNAAQDADVDNGAVPARLQNRWCSGKKNYGWKFKNEKSFTSTVFNHDMADHKDGVISQHLNILKSQPLSQGTHRKDTRC